MPQHDEELNRRREKREALRKKREAEQRRMRLALIAAAVVLVLCGVGIFLIARSAGITPQLSTSEKKEENVRQTEATKATQETTARRETTTTIHIKAAGDLNITDSVVNAGMPTGNFDYTRAFLDVAATMADADLTVLNFEGNLSGEPYGSERTSAPREILDGLRSMGVDLVQTANSCSINNGLIGLSSTLSAIRNAGLEPLGSYASSGEFEQSKGYTMCEVQGIKVAFVAFTKGFGGMGLPAGNTNSVNLLYEDYDSTYKKINKTGINAILKAVEEEKPDITIAMLHWGSEYNESVGETQEDIVEVMKKGGVDVILGTHSHLLQTIVHDRLAGTLVAYSLGDFFGDGTRGGSNYSIILDLEITKDSDAGITRVTNFDYIPIYTLQINENEGDYKYTRVVRIEEAMEAYNNNYVDKITESAYKSMEYAMQRIRERIATTKMVECPECEQDLEVLVNNEGKLVNQKTCKCGQVLKEGSNYADYN